MSRYFHRILTVVLTMTLLFAMIPFQAAAEPMAPPETGYIMDLDKGLCLEIYYDSEFVDALNDLNEFQLYPVDFDSIPKKLKPAKTASKAKRVGSRFLYNIENWSSAKNKWVETQYTYELRPNELRINGKAYTITQKQYESLKKAAAETEKKVRASEYQSYSPLWTTWTMFSDVVKLEFRDKDKVYPEKAVEKYKESLSLLARCFYIIVSPETKMYKTGSKLGQFPNAMEIIMTLKSGRKLSLIINGEKLYVEMSDRDYGYEYKLLDGDGKYIRESVRDLLKKQ